MIVDRIATLDEFEQLQSNWQIIHEQDPHAHLFSSWAWLRGYIDSTPFEWMALAISEGSREIACEALPLRSSSSPPTDVDCESRTEPHSLPYVGFVFLTLESKAFNTWRILRLGGSPLADYTGFVCLPTLEKQILTSVARYIKNELHWDLLHLWDVLDPRLEYLTFHFDSQSFYTSDRRRTPCPYIELPSTWEDFLATKLSKTVRKKVRRRTAQVQELDGFRLEPVDAQNLDTQIDTLFQLWEDKWQQPADQGLRPIFHQLFLTEQLWLTTLWAESTAIAGLAGFTDKPKRTFYAFMGAYNSDFEKLSPGVVLDGFSMAYAMENHLTKYDYLRGDHDYKFRWGAQARTIPHIEISSRSTRTAIISEAIKMTRKLKSF